MRHKAAFGSAVAAAAIVGLSQIGYAQQGDAHGWLNTETLKTRFGDFEFKNGYPAGDTAERLLELQTLNRAVEVYLTQLMPVSEIALREGMRAFGARKPTAGRDLGRPDGCQDGAADRQHRDRLCASAIST